MKRCLGEVQAAVNTTGDTRRPLQRPVRVPVEEVDSSEEEEDEAMLYTNRPNHFFTQASQPLEQINASSDAVISPT